MKQIYLIAVLFMGTLLSFGQAPLRVEPLNWWVGMKNPNVQILIRGNELKGSTITSMKSKLKIVQVHSADSPNYLFVDVKIAADAQPGIYPLIIKKNNQQTQVINYELEKRKVNSAQRIGFSNADVMYLIAPDRFANGDLTNDSAPQMREPNPARSEMYGRHGGDLKGIIDHLDYLQKMGFTAIWNMPVQENDVAKESYHGYSITNHYQIDPRFGTNEMYRQLGEEAKKKGIKLIMDVVLNHCGDGHWWMKDKPFNDWINFEGKFVSTSHRRETAQDPHASNFDKKLQTDGWFVPTMPDLNTQNPFLGTYLIQNAIWWIEYASLGGIRIDTWPYSTKEYGVKWAKSVLNEYPNFNLVGEEWSSNPIMTSYYQKGKVNRNGFVPMLPSLMDFPLQSGISEGMRGNDKDWGQGLNKIYEVLSNDLIYPNPNNLVIFGDNHDMSRFYTQVKHDVNLLKMGMTLLLTTRGIPQIFYGTEVLMSNPNSNEHGEIRSDFYGGWPNDKKDAVSGLGLTDAEKDVQAFFKKLLNWRKHNSVVHSGKLMHFGPIDGIYAYFRYNKKGKVMVVLNKNDQSKQVDLHRFEEILPKVAYAKNVLTDQSMVLGDYLDIPAKTALIFEIK